MRFGIPFSVFIAAFGTMSKHVYRNRTVINVHEWYTFGTRTRYGALINDAHLKCRSRRNEFVCRYVGGCIVRALGNRGTCKSYTDGSFASTVIVVIHLIMLSYGSETLDDRWDGAINEIYTHAARVRVTFSGFTVVYSVLFRICVCVCIVLYNIIRWNLMIKI